MTSTDGHNLDASDRRRRDRKIWRTGLLLSLLFHLLLFIGWRGTVIPSSPFAAAGPRAGDNRAAKGSMQALNMRVPPSRPIIRPPRPLAVAVEIEPVEFEDTETLDPSSVLGEAPGQDEGPGLETGTGEGDGGTAEEGFNRLQPPSPRGMIIPPANKDLKGTTVEVWVFVDERGRVVADSTRLNPPTRDRGFNQRLIREAAEWVFRPAIRAGQAVASWFPYQISM
jgi:hypothetical protein